jgi:hypothetical protein
MQGVWQVSTLRSNVPALRKLVQVRRILREVLEEHGVDVLVESKLRHALRLVDEVYDIVSFYES